MKNRDQAETIQILSLIGYHKQKKERISNEKQNNLSFHGNIAAYYNSGTAYANG